jgi:hypothetical protein
MTKETVSCVWRTGCSNTARCIEAGHCLNPTLESRAKGLGVPDSPTSKVKTTDWENLYNQAIAGRHAFRQMAIRYRNALKGAVEWAGPMGEAPVDSRPAWFDVARAALEGPTELSHETLAPLDFTRGGDAFHVLRILGNVQISAGKAAELLRALQVGDKPELMPVEGVAEEPKATTAMERLYVKVGSKRELQRSEVLNDLEAALGLPGDAQPLEASGQPTPLEDCPGERDAYLAGAADDDRTGYVDPCCPSEKALAPCECLVRDKTPSAYHNVKCPRYVEGAL